VGRRSDLETELDRITFVALVASEADGNIAPEDLELLQAAPVDWARTLGELLTETEEALAVVAASDREERDQALADLSAERESLADALTRLTGEQIEPLTGIPGLDHGSGNGAAPDEVPDLPKVPVLQASWTADQVVLWAGNPSVRSPDRDELATFIAEAGAGAVDWVPLAKGVTLPTGEKAAAVAAPIAAALGWLVGVGAGQLASETGASVRWMGEVATWATELVAQGRMVPSLRKATTPSTKGNRQRTGSYAVQWVPAMVDRRRLGKLSARMPGPVKALDTSAKAERLTRAILIAAVDAVCRTGAGRLVTAATPPVARTRRDVSEAVLAGLAGTPFNAAQRPATELADDLARWAAPVTGDGDVGLLVALDAPEQDGGWLLHAEATGVERQPLPIDKALTTASGAKAQRVEAQLQRLERLMPALQRSSKRGSVVLSPDEAWRVMTTVGPSLAAAGFEVRVPVASARRPSPRLRLEADPSSGPSRVGANQLSKVRWSVLFDDVELDARDIARLTAQARPMVRAKGRWVELDHDDLEAAAQALAERENTTELSGAAILRHAVGLEEGALGGPVAVDGSGWAVDLVQGATGDPPAPLPSPDGFDGELRSYQAQARGWLAFLDRVGLGGILAMDMGLGKTPTVLAHLLEHRGNDPVLVIAPPAVLGNWAAEAHRFTPGLRVHVHHGAARVEGSEVADVASNADLVLTTYATAVRDVDALAGIEWNRVVLDEAQAIKNPTSEAARELRAIPARSRLALTGTPIENGLGDLWSILDFVNPGLVGGRTAFIQALSRGGDGRAASAEAALRALNGLLVFRRTKAEPEIAAELPDKIDELDHCGMTPEQIGLYQAVLDQLVGVVPGDDERNARTAHVLAAITALKQICDHPAAYLDDDSGPLAGRSGKLSRLEELIDGVFEAGERMLIFTHFARWGEKLASHLTEYTGKPIACYHGGLTRGVRDRLVREFQEGTGPGALVLSIKAGGSGLNLTAANHVVLYDRWWNPAVEDQARDRSWRIGQEKSVISHRLVCPGTVDEQVEEVVAGKRRIADLVLPASSSVGDLTPDQLRTALGLRPEAMMDDPGGTPGPGSGSRGARVDQEDAA
jgi:SNF2-related domain/SNF2 Helicase protein/Helicase conserved C-terminal domain